MSVVAHDPVAMVHAQRLIPEVEFAADPYSAIEGADAVAIVTEWPEYLELNWQRAASLVRRRIVVDGRNCLDPDVVTAAGFNYHGMGRPSRTTQWARRVSDHHSIIGEHVA